MPRHRNVTLLGWFNFFTDFRLYAPVAIIYFAQVTGSYTTGMAVFSVAMLSTAILEVPTGVVSDYIGRKYTMVFGAVASIASVVCYALGGSFFVLAVGACFEGLTRALYSGNNDALLHDSLSEQNDAHNYAEHFGTTSAPFQIGLGIASLIGGFLAAESLQLLLWLSVLPQVAAFGISLFIREPVIRHARNGNVYAHLREAISEFVRNKRLRYLSISSIIGHGFGEAVFEFRAAFVKMLWPMWALGIARALSHLAAAASFYLSGRLVKRFTELKLLIAANVYGSVAELVAVLFPTVLSPAIDSSGSIFFGTAMTSRSSLLQKEFTPHQRATMASLNSFACSLAFAVASVVVGYLADRFGVITAIVVVNVIILAHTWIYFVLMKMDTRERKILSH